MKLFFFFITSLFISQSVFAVATQTVTISSSAINEINITTAIGTLTISSATAGSLPNSATSSTGRYAITTNGTTMKITGSLNTNMPSNLQLNLTLTAPTGATSAGSVSLSTTAVNLVTNISKIAQSNLSMTATFAQTAAVNSTSSFTRTLTLTLLQGP